MSLSKQVIFQEREDFMNNWMYSLYALVLGVFAFFTGEIVTFIMLGFILIALININTTLKQLVKKDDKQSQRYVVKGYNR